MPQCSIQLALGIRNIKHLRVFYIPLDGMPQSLTLLHPRIRFSIVERITVTVKCCAQELSAMTLARAWTTQSRVQCPVTALDPLNDHASAAKSIYRVTIKQADLVHPGVHQVEQLSREYSVNVLVGVCHWNTESLTLFLIFLPWSAWFSDPLLNNMPFPIPDQLFFMQKLYHFCGPKYVN